MQPSCPASQSPVWSLLLIIINFSLLSADLIDGSADSAADYVRHQDWPLAPGWLRRG